jgi:hypothetical protein
MKSLTSRLNAKVPVLRIRASYLAAMLGVSTTSHAAGLGVWSAAISILAGRFEVIADIHPDETIQCGKNGKCEARLSISQYFWLNEHSILDVADLVRRGRGKIPSAFGQNSHAFREVYLLAAFPKNYYH